MRIALMIRALYRGAQLARVETWKKKGVALAAVSGLLSALVGIAVTFGWLSDVPPQLIMEVSSALVSLVMFALGYLQVATTEKIGLPDRRSGTDGVLHAETVGDPEQRPGSSADDARDLWLDFSDDD